MRIRIATTAVGALLAFTVVGCSADSDADSDSKAGATSTAGATDEPGAAGKADGTASSAPKGSGTAKSGIPPKPSGAERDAVLAAIHDVNGSLTHDEDKAIDAARNQCSALDGGAADPDHGAAQRFSYDGVTLTDDDGKHINFGLRKTLCPAS